ncbi:hypothetical protein MKX79_03810 [Viridibacillus sp. FSL R5-0468]|uniref:hypothetical protein n=1 Tax=Viridibacillus sp. FSL R5-0468 TaxID=2921640 RepID=UPI0030FBA21D
MEEQNFTETDLLNAVKAEVEDVVKDILCKQGDKLITPNVYKYFTPKIINKTKDEGVYPAVIVRFLEADVDSDKQYNDDASIRIIAVVKDEDHEEGIDGALGIARKLKEHFQKKYFIGSFDITGKMKIFVPEEQEYPNWQAVIDFSMSIPAVQTNVL